MKKISILLSLLCLLAGVSFAQDSLHVKWILRITASDFGKFELNIHGDIQPGWHLYTKGRSIDGLEGIKVSFADSSLVMASAPAISGNLKRIIDPIFQNSLDIAEGSIDIKGMAHVNGQDPPITKAIISYSIANDSTFLPEEIRIPIDLDTNRLHASNNIILIPSIDLKHPVNDCGGTGINTDKGLMALFFLGFIGGLVALLTPCVFPMIPLTVSFFTKGATSRKKGISNAVLYGFFIFLIYVLLSLPFHFLDKLDPEILNNVSTNVYLNIFFFIVFIVFAFSFFGFYEITLPGSISNKADSKANSGRIIGIFFMALTLAIVSFSCTGPILGSLLAGSLSANGGAIQLTAGMAGFGLALALPFALFALFPNWLTSLPKSGGWLHTVKVVLGFIELALAFKFLSNADQVKHWGLLKREVFIGIWILIGILSTLYLFERINFSEDKPHKLGKFRIFVGIVFALFTVYLIPGLTNTKYANLSLISGFPPPLSYSIYHNQSDCLFDLDCSHDFEEGMRMAKAENKPILLDFTGYACVNCRRMEEKVWSRPDVLKIMRDKFIVISLYVDDKKELPAAEQFTYKTKDGVEKEIKTVGDKWATFETENFQNNAQPLYALLNTDTVLLNHPVAYTPDAAIYKQWLQCGLDAFGNRK